MTDSELKSALSDLARRPGSPRLVRTSDALIQRGKLGEAERVLRRGLKAGPGRQSVEVALAELLADTDRQAQAIESVRRLMPNGAGNVRLGLLHLRLLLDQSRFDEARREGRRLRQLGVDEGRLRPLLVRVPPSTPRGAPVGPPGETEAAPGPGPAAEQRQVPAGVALERLRGWAHLWEQA